MWKNYNVHWSKPQDRGLLPIILGPWSGCTTPASNHFDWNLSETFLFANQKRDIVSVCKVYDFPISSKPKEEYSIKLEKPLIPFCFRKMLDYPHTQKSSGAKEGEGLRFAFNLTGLILDHFKRQWSKFIIVSLKRQSMQVDCTPYAWLAD